jgi:hypothetical protein
MPSVINYLTLYPSTITGGQTSTYNYVYLTGVAGSEGVPVTLASDNPGIAAVSSFTIPAGMAWGSFPIVTAPVAAPVQVGISATTGTITQTVVLTVSP